MFLEKNKGDRPFLHKKEGKAVGEKKGTCNRFWIP